MVKRKVRLSEILLNGSVFLSTALSALALGLIFFYVIREGTALLNWDLFVGNYHSHNYIAELQNNQSQSYDMPDYSNVENVYPVDRFGIVLQEDIDLAGNGVVRVYYVHPDSPFNQMISKEVGTEVVDLDVGMIFQRISYVNHPTSLSRGGAQKFATELNDPQREVFEMFFSDLGGGIKGSIITTIYLIFMTLIIAVPFGVLTAIYFNEFAPSNWITKTMRSFIETLTGVPSIIYGLLGITVFVPLTVRFTPAVNSNLIAGALTLSVIILPTIIRTTEESLRVVPDDHRAASLALGANKTQTTFKVVLPQASPGIITATFLGIGRVIGESAALIFVLGAAIKDTVNIYEPSTSLAVHIWSMMTDEPANIALSSTIAILILAIVLVINVSVKIGVKLLTRKGT